MNFARLCPPVATAFTALSIASFANAADYAPAATAAITWTPNITAGVGVPGGIPARSTIHTTITATGDTTDRAQAIMLAMNNCPTGQTVLLGPGTFYVSSLLFTQNARWITYPTVAESGAIGGKTLRGSGSDPSTGTVIKMLPGTGYVFFKGSEFYGTSYRGAITGSPIKGATTLSATNLDASLVNSLVVLETADDETLPVIHTSGFSKNKRQVVFVTAVDTGAGTFTFQPPLYQTPVKRTGGALAMSWFGDNDIPTLRGAGVEDIAFDGTDVTAARDRVVDVLGAHASWWKNIRLKGVLKHGIYMSEVVQCELRDSFIEPSRDPSWTSSNHAGLGLGMASANLIENNVIVKHFPLIKLEGAATSGNVFGYNFCLQAANVYALGTHNAGNHCNLWEGNSFTGIATDGYFGSAADDVIYRNDLHGVVLGSAIPHFPVELGRFTRRFEIVGNQMGRAGTTLNIETGHPTPYNWTTNGEANNYAGDPHVDTLLTGVLTTRTSDSAGTITFDTTIGQMHGNLDVTLLGVTWGTDWGTIRYNMDKGTTNNGARTVVVTGGGGAALPAQGTAVKVFTLPNGYKERDDGTLPSLVLLGNNYASAGGTIPTAQALGSTTLPTSLYRGTKPAFMSNYTWPPFDPQTPDRRFAAIPAGARYEGAIPANRSPSVSKPVIQAH